MQLSNSFRIDRPVPEVFDTFLDVERVATCMPGSRLLGKSGEDTYDGEVKVKAGPLSFTFSGQLTLLDVDPGARSMAMRGKGKEQRGAGTADAHVVVKLVEQDGGTLVQITTDLSIRGKVAQFGRGVMSEVTDGIIQEFAANVERMLAGGGFGGSAAGSAGEALASASVSAHAGGELRMWSVVGRPLLERHGRPVGLSVLAVILVCLAVRSALRRSA